MSVDTRVVVAILILCVIVFISVWIGLIIGEIKARKKSAVYVVQIIEGLVMMLECIMKDIDLGYIQDARKHILATIDMLRQKKSEIETGVRG